ncbi:MAG: hypothetical protein WBN77_13695 [Desulfobacterales bacterium]|uniref:Uncharacterized protein n=1 Tax=uncultured Desulfobacterium sp. TaxID=201089 RepID=E1YJ83_9BACT|nr:unknown protein [uncultured Desulfobacterium sp.]
MTWGPLYTIEGAVENINPYSIDKNSKEKNQDKEKELETGGYPVRFKLFASELKIKNGSVYKIKPGMSVTAEINVGKRRVIEFSFSRLYAIWMRG